MRKYLTIAAVTGMVLACVSGAQAVDMEWVSVGDRGNMADTTGYGAVDYAYNIGTYEVTNAQYAEFLNAVATVGDPNGLYNTEMGGGWNDIGGISRTGSGTAGDPGRTRRGPIAAIAGELCGAGTTSLRFANWMHNDQPSGSQGASTTEDGAYDMSLGSSVVRKPEAQVFLPSEDEWYKAAYYKGGGTSAGYWDYPTQSDTAPTAEAPPGTDMTNGSANYYDHHGGGYADPYYTTEVGAYDAKPSDSAYGTFDQGGNLWEWNEADLFDDGTHRGLRGGAFDPSGDDGDLQAWHRNGVDPSAGNLVIGFRVSEVPEPATIALLALGGLALLRRRRG